MLYEFLKANRPELIERCRAKVAVRRAPVVTPAELDHGIPLFLDQLTQMLPGGVNSEAMGAASLLHPSMAEQQIRDGAARHGTELLRHDFTIEQMVHDYGDLCQAITELASEQDKVISTQEFGVLNIRLDNAIAGAVTEYARRNRAAEVATYADLSAIVHELRNLHNTSIVALTAMRNGTVGFTGATATAFDASMARAGRLIDRAVSLIDAE